MIAAPIESVIEHQRERIRELECAEDEARRAIDAAVERLRDVRRALDRARAHLADLLTFSDGGPA